MIKPTPYSALQKTLLACMILVPFIPFVLALAIGWYYFSASIENATVAAMQRIVRDHRQMIESFLMERKADADANLTEAAYTMISQNKRRLTVMDSEKVIGIIREQDLFFEIERILREA